MDIGIQIRDPPTGSRLNFSFPARLALRILRGPATAVDGIGEVAVAVDIHVGEFRARAVEVDGVFSTVGKGFATVGPFCRVAQSANERVALEGGGIIGDTYERYHPLGHRNHP